MDTQEEITKKVRISLKDGQMLITIDADTDFNDVVISSTTKGGNGFRDKYVIIEKEDIV